MSELALKLIAENKKTKAKFLDLGNCGLVNYLPDELFDCVWLEELSFNSAYSSNSTSVITVNSFSGRELINLQELLNLKKIDLSICKIRSLDFFDNFTLLLEELTLSMNDISDLTDFKYFNFKSSLKKLDLYSNKIRSIEGLKNLKNLEVLGLGENEINDAQPLRNLSNLQYLNLNHNYLSDISFLNNLKELNELSLKNNRVIMSDNFSNLKKLRTLSLDSNNITNIRFLKGLSQLQTLNLSKNAIIDILTLSNLKQLRFIDLSSNKISDFTWGGNLNLKNLPQLQHIDFSNNNIQNLKYFEELLRDNFHILLEDENIFISDYYKNKKIIKLFDNLTLIPPTQIIEQGSEAILRYFGKIEEEGKDYIYESKLTIVGDGGSGKTSLQERIIDKNATLPKIEERTRGIKISNWHFKDKESKNYTVNIWDFGGQDVYYPVHRFFLTENSVYVLMASTRIQSHNFEYWIPTIYQFGGNSPIILVQTCHDNNRSHWNDLGIFYSEPDFNIPHKHFELNLPNRNEGLSILENAIEQQIIQLPHIGKPVPKSWVKVRAALAERQKIDACISYEKFIEICQTVDAENFQKLSDVELLGRFFADLGIILWYHNKEYLKGWVILQPQWAMLAVYKIIDDIEVQKCGIIRKSDFKRLWSEEIFLQKHELLKNMFQVFKIAFPKKHSKEDFILPARLNSLPEGKRWTNIDKNIRLEYTFDFMPRGIVNQLSAELSRQIKSDSDVWNNAVNFVLNDSEAQVVEDYFKRNLYIKANGQDARSLVVLIMESIENILEDYKGVKPTKNVPCNCPTCQKSENPELFSYTKLIEWSKIRSTIFCNESSTELIIQNLLYNVGLIRTLKTRLKDSAISDMNDRNNMEGSINNINTISPVFNINTNPQTSTAPETPKEGSDIEKKLKALEKQEENRKVKNWKNRALITFIVSLLLTFGGLYVYMNELGGFDWKTLKAGELFKWIGIGIMAILNGFPIKMMYDRFLDVSKEKAFRDNLKTKQ